MAENAAKLRFEQGSYAALVSEYLDHSKPSIDPSIRPYVIGALFFLDRNTEATSLLKGCHQVFGVWEQSFIQFCEILHTHRSGNLQRGRYQISLLLLSIRKTPKESVRYFGYQTLAFHYYFRGRLDKSKDYARKALGYATVGFYSYGKILSLDLLGHIETQSGKVRSGLSHIKQAIELSQSLGNDGITTSLYASQLLYQSQFGIDLDQTIEEIDKLINQNKFQNAHSKPSLMLEKVRILILKGQLSTAEKHLNSIATLVLGGSISRLHVVFYLRQAWICLLKREYQRSLEFATTAFELSKTEDKLIQEQVLGFFNELDSKISLSKAPQYTLQKRLKHLNGHRYLNSRIEQRNRAQAYRISVFEDPLGHQLDIWKSNAFKDWFQIFGSEVPGFFYKSPYFSGEKNAIYFSPTHQLILVCQNFELKIPLLHISEQMCKLLQAFIEKRVTKELLAEKIWGQVYKPQKHDASIYNLLQRFRKLLGSHGLVQMNDLNEYELQMSLHLLPDFQDGLAKSNIGSNAWEFSKINNAQELNQRQRVFLEKFKGYKEITVSNYAKHFNISLASARRDVGKLVQMQYLLKVKRGKLTHYKPSLSLSAAGLR